MDARQPQRGASMDARVHEVASITANVVRPPVREGRRFALPGGPTAATSEGEARMRGRWRLRRTGSSAGMPSRTPRMDSALGMSFIDTPDLRLVWFEPLGYLVPQTIRTFTNSLEWQRRMLGWVADPSARPIVLRTWATTAMRRPRRRRATVWPVDVAPLSHAFETYPASERLYTLVNHELVHVAPGRPRRTPTTRDGAACFWARSRPQPEHPESLLYGYLTVPALSRAHAGIPRARATFIETWMSGGARPRAGRLRRDGVPRDGAGRRPLLRPARARIARRALPTSRSASTPTSTARGSSPGSPTPTRRRRCWPGCAATSDSERHYADRFEQVFGLPLDRAWQDWIAFEHEFQRTISPRSASIRSRRYRKLVDGRSAASRTVHFDEATGMLYGGFRTPGIVDHIGALDTRNGTLRRLADIKRAMLYRVTSFAFDPGSGTAFYTADNYALPRPDGGRRAHRRVADAARGCAHRRASHSIPSTAR